MQKFKEIIRNYSPVIIFILSAAIICGELYCFFSSNTRNYDYGIWESMDKLEKGIGRAGDRISYSQNEVEKSRVELNRAKADTRKLAEQIERNRKALDECERILERGEKRTQDINAIIRDVEESNQRIRTQTEST